MWQEIAYCGLPPLPGSLLTRFNLDPVLIAALLGVSGLHLAMLHREGKPANRPMLGWAMASAAVITPVCALSVALFSARIAQHMILVLVAAPLVANGFPSSAGRKLWPAAAAFFIVLWAWHMPGPYDATFHSIPLYWAMHVTLFGCAVWLWRELIGHRAGDTGQVLAAGIASSMQMSLLGALLTLGNHAWYAVHYFTTEPWGFSPLQDQQLGGALMWVPGCGLFFWAALRSMHRVWLDIERRQPA